MSPFLDETTTDPDPIRQFTTWLDQAREAGLHEPEAMALATAGADGRPTVRIVLLRGVGPDGFDFYTNYDSLKGRQLAENPRASLLFHWYPPGRQVRVEGVVERLSREESERYFARRPRGHRIGAWASAQGRPIPDRAYLEDRAAAEAARFQGRDVPLPPYWGGYRLRPDAMEVWQARSDRLHDRLVYLPNPDGGWSRTRLSP